MLAPIGKPLSLMLQLLGVLIGVLLIALLIVPLVGPGWHLLHGDFIVYEGWRVPVPKGFYVGKSQMGPTMWKHTLGTPLFNVPYGHISLFSRPHPFACDRDYSRFEKGVTQSAGQSGYQLESKRTISVGKNSGYCLEFTRLSGEPRSLVRCVVENSVVVLFYEGDPRYISDFFAALQGMSLESNKSGCLYQYDGEYGLTWSYDASGQARLTTPLPASLLGRDFVS